MSEIEAIRERARRGYFLSAVEDVPTLLAEVDRLRDALRTIAFWEGPGNNRNRVEACKALGCDPRETQPWDVG